MLIKLFSTSITAEELRANINGKSALLQERSQFGPKFQVHGVVPHQPFFSRWKTTMIWYKMKAEVSFVLSQFMRVTDRRLYDSEYRIAYNTAR